ncbi:MAG: 50S ribosomal protein L19 [Candidatus Moranbacteria bacterium]|jgi:large subunit ribosomal protein L19|nr:50S ribosomal protein L19 [Candidatus Moranbacteria bacterium]
MHQSLISFNLKQRKAYAELPELRAGDVIKIYRKIKEGAKERTQMFQGTVIALKGGQSASRTMTVRKVSDGIGVELIFPLSSTQIQKIEFVKRTTARRAKLYFVRDKSAKVLSKKLKEVAVKESMKPKKKETASVVPEMEAAATKENKEA